MVSTASRVLFLIIGLTVVVICAMTVRNPVNAQNDTPGWNKNVAKATPKATPKPTRTRRPPPRRPQPSQPLLAVQFRIFKVNDNNSQVEVNPATVFNKGDRLRIAMKANQDVYLYVIHQDASTANGQLFFPDSRVNSGQNLLAKDTEMVLPSGCPPGTPPQMCAFIVDGNPGEEIFTMIFTRNSNLDLLDNASNGLNSDLSPQVLTSYSNSLNQKLDVTGRADSVFGRSVKNTNPKANDKIFVRYNLNKRG